MCLSEAFLTCFLFTEFAVLLILTMPFRTSKQWNQMFKRRTGKLMTNNANYIFIAILSVLIVILLDTIIDLGSSAGEQWHLKLKENEKLFHNQYNFYKACLTIFNFIIIRRLVVLISAQARLKKEKRKAKINALGALAAFHTLAEIIQNNEEEEDEDEEQVTVQDTTVKKACGNGKATQMEAPKACETY